MNRTLAHILVVALVLAGGSAFAFINPKFTPVDLVKQSEMICVVTLVATADPDRVRVPDVTDLKGKTPPFALDLSTCKPTEHAGVRKLIASNGTTSVILFAAKSDDGMKGYLHVSGQWIEVTRRDARTWQVVCRASRLSGTWAGGTDMLIRLTRYVLADADAEVPTSVAMSWMDTQADLGKLDGKPNGLAAVLLPDGELYVFAALDTGDRIFRAKKNDEVFTATMRLTTRSRRFAWTDLDGDGRVDLVSWNGKTIALWRISKAGTFERADGGKGFALRGCIGLAPCALHKGGTPAVVVSTPDFPFLLHRQDGGWVRTALPMPRLRGELLPTTCACIVADLDGDGWWDALQPRPVRGYLWKGGPTGLTGPEPSTVTANGKDARFTLGDFNGDGALDVFCADEKTNALWENDGKATFQNVTAGAGSLSYKLPTGASDCLAADLNHDGRTDLALLHPKGAFSYHFNRGFRCLGEEGELRLPGGSRGQWAGVVADCNCDGSLDLVVALSDGRLRCYYNAAFEKPILRVALKKGSSAPVTVSVWQGKDHPVCVGAFPVGAQPAWTLFTTGKSRRGTLKYRLGDSPERTQTLRLPPELPDRGYDVTLDGAYAPRLLPKAP